MSRMHLNFLRNGFQCCTLKLMMIMMIFAYSLIVNCNFELDLVALSLAVASLLKVSSAFQWIYEQVCCSLNYFQSLSLRSQFHDLIVLGASILSAVCWKIGRKRRNYSARRLVNPTSSVCSKKKWVFWKVDHRPAHRHLASLRQAYVQRCICRHPFFTRIRARKNREHTEETFAMVLEKKRLFANTKLAFFLDPNHFKFL